MKISSVLRISFSIVSLCVAVVVFAAAVGLLPDNRIYEATNRSKLSETVASGVCYQIAQHNVEQAGKQLELFANHNPDLISIGLRRSDGGYAAEVGSHRQQWFDAKKLESDGCYEVPIENGAGQWGTLEVQFAPQYVGLSRYLSRPLLQLICLIIAVVGVGSWFNLRQVLRYLDPSRSVPTRVRQALDSFAEGILILDKEDRIVLANQKFARDVKREQDELLGMNLWDIPWQTSDLPSAGKPKGGISFEGSKMQLLDNQGQVLVIFSVNSSQVTDDAGNYQGLMLAFTDVTPLERNRAALLETLEDLSRSKKAIAEQNKELTFLATRDPLTSCVNRRTFFDLFEKHWEAATTSGVPLGVMMVDIDFFKPINDNYGHSKGDEVLRETGRLLNELTREVDVVCRYGGEEFAILMPDSQLDAVEASAERIRIGISELEFGSFSITASLGVSGFNLGASDPHSMLDQADKCLYVAKRNGRNQVIRFDTVPADLVVDESKISREKPIQNELETQSIPYSAVAALLAALSYRDQQTGLHSLRVSKLAALLAQRVLGPKDVYVIEMAALLHDIGKVGVPDSVLLKADKLTDDEWKLMEQHDRLGIEILNKSFKHNGMTEIVRYHHCRFDSKDGSAGAEIPIGARILTIVDAYDAMVSDRPYRDGMPSNEAIAELRNHAGAQFDPELVEIFVEIIQTGDHESEAASEVNYPEVRFSNVSYSDDVILDIGEQVERLAVAADRGDGKTFSALAKRLQDIARKNNVHSVVAATAHAIDVASEDDSLERLANETFELLNVCRSLRTDQEQIKGVREQIKGVRDRF